MSFLKGSAEAVRTPTGELSREMYLDMGAKKAPNFSREQREQVGPEREYILGWFQSTDIDLSPRVKTQVFALLGPYQLALRAVGFDRPDIVSYIYRGLKHYGYLGKLWQSIIRVHTNVGLDVLILQRASAGVPVEYIFRDEVQDFLQAELLLDLLVAPGRANYFFYCGKHGMEKC